MSLAAMLRALVGKLGPPTTNALRTMLSERIWRPINCSSEAPVDSFETLRIISAKMVRRKLERATQASQLA